LRIYTFCYFGGTTADAERKFTTLKYNIVFLEQNFLHSKKKYEIKVFVSSFSVTEANSFFLRSFDLAATAFTILKHPNGGGGD